MGTYPIPLIDETVHATTRYLGALTVLEAEDLEAPSALPGWTRGHVVAHLSRNADAFTRVLGQAAAGEAASMYDSPESRDFDIDATVADLSAKRLLADAVESARRFEKAAAVYDGPPGCDVHPRPRGRRDVHRGHGRPTPAHRGGGAPRRPAARSTAPPSGRPSSAAT